MVRGLHQETGHVVVEEGNSESFGLASPALGLFSQPTVFALSPLKSSRHPPPQQMVFPLAVDAEVIGGLAFQHEA